MYVYIYIYTHAYVCVYIYTHIYIYICPILKALNPEALIHPIQKEGRVSETVHHPAILRSSPSGRTVRGLAAV